LNVIIVEVVPLRGVTLALYSFVGPVLAPTGAASDSSRNAAAATVASN
jgi:hypothetical protein